MRYAYRPVGYLAMLLMLARIGPAFGQDIVWQIGKFDNSYAELGKTQDYREYGKFYPKDVVYVVGKSDARRDWPFIHPGPRDRWAGRKPHTHIVEFQLDTPPTGTFTLRLDLVNVHYKYPPRLTIRVNERGGVFSLPAGADDAALTDPSKGREHVLDIGFDAALLKQGSNRITLLNDSGSLVLYDALAMLRGRHGASGSSRLTASATNLFVDTKTGLQRLATLHVAGPAAQAGGRLRIAVNGKTVEHKIDGVPLGDNRQQVTFPPIEKAGEARVELVSGAETLTTYPRKLRSL